MFLAPLMASAGAGLGTLASGAAVSTAAMGGAAAAMTPAALIAASAVPVAGTFSATTAALGAGAASAGMLGQASLMSSAFGTVMDSYGQYQAGKTNQKIANRNADISRRQAADARFRGGEAEGRQRLATAMKIGEQRAQMSAAGIDVGAGSALDVLGDTAAFGEQDALTIRANAEREAWGYGQQAVNEEFSGKVARQKGTQGAMSSLIGGAGAVADKWYKYNRGF